MQIGKLVQEGAITIKTGPFGTQLKASEYQESGTPVLNVKNLGYGSVSSAKLDHVGSNTVERLRIHLLKKGDIVFGRKGAVDRHAYIDDESDGWMQGSDCIRLRVETADINPRFLSYYFLTNKHKAFMVSMCSHGTTMASLNQNILEQIDFPFLERKYQDKIAGSLEKIDEKIKVNQKINENLEQQAAAYFHHQFIANADPSWKEGAISDLGAVIGGSTPSKSKPEYYTDNGIAWITPKDLSIDKSKFISHGADDITELGLKNSSASIMPAGTVLFSSRAPIGYIAIADGEVTTNQGFKSVVPNNNAGTAFVYYFLKNALPTIENMASGSTFKEISASAMRKVPAIIPDDESLQEFADFCEPLFEQQRTLEAENRFLAALRDSLLPKLMSGELDVSNLEL
jgi:type I restriction enzyme S subunit